MEDDGYGGYGKAQRGRRHRTQAGRTPYARPPPRPAPKEEQAPASKLPPNEPGRPGLFGSLRSLITKVRALA